MAYERSRCGISRQCIQGTWYVLKISWIHKESKRLAKAKHTHDGKAKYETFLTETFKFPAPSKEALDCTEAKESAISKFTKDVVSEVTSKLV